jgi:hypothetical protein
MPRHDLVDVDLRPSFIKEHIARPKPSLELVINRENAPDGRARSAGA